MTKPLSPKIRSAIRSALRKIWMWQDEDRKAVKRSAWISKGTYKCELCLSHVSKIDIDHKEAVGATPGSRVDDGTATWDRMIERMFCSEEGLQAICKECHKGITNEAKSKNSKRGSSTSNKS